MPLCNICAAYGLWHGTRLATGCYQAQQSKHPQLHLSLHSSALRRLWPHLCSPWPMTCYPTRGPPQAATKLATGMATSPTKQASTAAPKLAQQCSAAFVQPMTCGTTQGPSQATTKLATGMTTSPAQQPPTAAFELAHQLTLCSICGHTCAAYGLWQDTTRHRLLPSMLLAWQPLLQSNHTQLHMALQHVACDTARDSPQAARICAAYDL